jgi:hypothetical protein
MAIFRNISLLIFPLLCFLFLLFIEFDSFFFNQSLQYNRHTYDKMHYKKVITQQTIGEREEKIDQLLTKSLQLNEKVN